MLPEANRINSYSCVTNLRAIISQLCAYLLILHGFLIKELFSNECYGNEYGFCIEMAWRWRMTISICSSGILNPKCYHITFLQWLIVSKQNTLVLQLSKPRPKPSTQKDITLHAENRSHDDIRNFNLNWSDKDTFHLFRWNKTLSDYCTCQDVLMFTKHWPSNN